MSRGRGLFRPARPTAARPRRRKATVPVAGAHRFEEDLMVPPDHRGRVCCRRCGKPGEEGDLTHPIGALPSPSMLPPVAPEQTEYEQRRLGERPDTAA